MRRLVVAILLLVFLLQAGRAIVSQSATFDEVQYFGIGKYLLQEGKWDVMGAILHPPLTYYLSSVPLLFVKQDDAVWRYEERERGPEFLGAVDFYRGQKLLAADENRDDRLLIASRLMIALLGALLGCYIYRFAGELYGRDAGLLSLAIFSFCPNMLAYAGLIVPDFPLTVFSFIAVYHFRRVVLNDTPANRVSAGLFLGLALLTKFTAFLLLPVAALCGVLFLGRQPARLTGILASVLAVSALVLITGYRFDLTPFIQGVQYQAAHASDGHESFLLGNYSIHGWWYYYPVALALKTPLPVIVLFSASCVVSLKRIREREADEWFLLLPMAMIVGFFSLKHQSIGLRYILPAFPFAFVLIGSLVEKGRKTAAWAYPLVAWLVIASLAASPHYIAYFNELVGGGKNGYRYLVDSNLDWGQDLKGLKRYMDEKGITRITLSYFGADSPERYGISYDWLPSNYLFNPDPGRDWTKIPPNQPLAVSVTNLQGVYFTDKGLFRWLMEHRPVAAIGHSIFIYDLGKDAVRSEPR